MTDLFEPGSPDVLYAVDLSGFVTRYFYTPFPNSAAKNFIAFLQRIIDQQAPAYFAIAADTDAPTFRDEHVTKRARSKESSPGERTALLKQRRVAQELASDLLGLRTLKASGFEADDVLATLTAQARSRGLRVVVIAHDKDMLQLVDTDRVLVWDGKEAVTGEREVFEKFGVWPKQIADYLALVGDLGDGIPGVRGVGEVAARKILAMEGSLENALNSEVPKLVSAGRKHCELMRYLTTLRADVPIDLDSFEELRVT